MPFIGQLDFGAIDPSADVSELTLGQPLGWLCGNTLMVCPAGSLVNGASIPRILWPILGSPLGRVNRVWSAVHDCGYRDEARYIDVSHDELKDIKLKYIIEFLAHIPRDAIMPRPNRLWHDQQMKKAMRSLHVPSVKIAACYAGVRLGGWASWRDSE